jgi:quercetin dioxygenase-like cupin family protein
MTTETIGSVAAGDVASDPRWRTWPRAAAALVLGLGLVSFALRIGPFGVGEIGGMTAAWPVDRASGHSHGQISQSVPDSDGDAEARPVTTLDILSCTPLPHVDGKSVTTAIVGFPPDAYTPAHRHPGSVTAFVLKGSVRSRMQGEAPQVYPRGATWFEPPNALHLFAENASSTRPAELLAVFVADSDCGPLVVPE